MKIVHLCAMLLSAAAGSAAQAQPAYPSKPIRIVVPYVAGGAADITARIVGQKMAEGLHVPVIIDNRPGANGMIGTDAVAKAAPDGYTLVLLASGPLVVNPVLYAKVPYDPIKDFAPISLLTSYQYVLTVPAASPIRTVPDLVSAAKAKPGQLSYGSTGVGGGGHLAGVMFGLMSGAEFTHVPYKGAAPALADLLGGTLSFTFDTVVTAVPFIKDGKLRA
ncbi:tripartite tricarboxylate transporter substrate-binding protein, partial [Variovorax sp. J22R133]|uniref:Bug family tripartite tricarboxylate transporter substrate binding protein n=1 Tax=Variovorax brevis TaxID=3053503 RepID=UPI002575B133